MIIQMIMSLSFSNIEKKAYPSFTFNALPNSYPNLEPDRAGLALNSHVSPQKILRLRFRVRVNHVSMPEKELKTPKGVAHLEQIPKARP